MLQGTGENGSPSLTLTDALKIDRLIERLYYKCKAIQSVVSFTRETIYSNAHSEANMFISVVVLDRYNFSKRQSLTFSGY